MIDHGNTLAECPAPSAVDDSPTPAALESLPASPHNPAPIDIAAETSPATLPRDFGRNDRPANIASPGERLEAHGQRLLFDVEGSRHVA